MRVSARKRHAFCVSTARMRCESPKCRCAATDEEARHDRLLIRRRSCTEEIRTAQTTLVARSVIACLLERCSGPRMACDVLVIVLALLLDLSSSLGDQEAFLKNLSDKVRLTAREGLMSVGALSSWRSCRSLSRSELFSPSTLRICESRRHQRKTSCTLMRLDETPGTDRGPRCFSRLLTAAASLGLW